jgi:hypothetical protein
MPGSFIDPYDCCPLCGCSTFADAYVFDIKEIRIRCSRCINCGLVFQNPRLSDDALRKLYAETDYFGLRSNDNRMGAYADFLRYDPMRIKQGRRRIARIVSLTGLTGGRLLDVGSASGFFGVAARDTGFEVTCIEPDVELAKLGHERYGLTFMAKPMEECVLEPGGYDIVTAWGTESLFLHPVRSIQKLVAALRPGGILALTYQAYNHWIRSFFPNLMHGWNIIYNHTDKSFGIMLRKVGMDMVASELEWQTVTIDHFGRVLRMKTPEWMRHAIVRLPAISMRFVVARKAANSITQ